MPDCREEAAIVKGMLARGGKQQWIIAWFGGDFNQARQRDQDRHERRGEVQERAPVPIDRLPPVGA